MIVLNYTSTIPLKSNCRSLTIIFYGALFLSFFVNAANGQPNKKIIIEGLLQDNISKSAIPFANFSIVGTGLGASSDSNGKFFLSVNEGLRNNKVRISCIGYYSKEIVLQELNKPAVFLEPATILLNEISIRADTINPIEIIRNAIKNIASNYLQTPFNVQYLSVITLSKATDTLKEVGKIESILDGYSLGYIDGGKRGFNIAEVRITGSDPLNGYYLPTHEIYTIDVIANPLKFGILNPDNLAKISFSYKGATIFDMDTVYNISYVISKPTKKLTGFGIAPKYFKGSVTITTGTFAIVRHEIRMDRFRYLINYRLFNNYYFPYSISGTRRNISDELDQNSYVVKNDLSLLSIIDIGATPLTGHINETDFNTVNRNKSFWDLNFPDR